MLTSQQIAAIHHIIRSVILTCFGMFIIYLVRTGSLHQYVEPNLNLYVKLSAMGLFATAIYQLHTAWEKWHGIEAAACDCNHDPSPSAIANVFYYSLFLLPLALGFLR
ncbi:DUF1980 domain-containing protein [Paenibacillus montanisoli]|uniref:DUF1980 domain-containing protein n=1 Tax=Paenibacillus montanisoli TaxID=2081970 RepID=A0A328U5P3_9BACL|nr:DUF1980 domain-containing protein [Paenibacillus montanisoli]RAP75354.1 hypothetical protein DL346_18515 [Paenibacillus montanisoli]